MKTSHQLARELLAGPDLPIFIGDPNADEREDVCKEPQLSLVEGYTTPTSGEEVEMIEIHGGAPVVADINIEL